MKLSEIRSFQQQQQNYDYNYYNFSGVCCSFGEDSTCWLQSLPRSDLWDPTASPALPARAVRPTRWIYLLWMLSQEDPRDPRCKKKQKFTNNILQKHDIYIHLSIYIQYYIILYNVYIHKLDSENLITPAQIHLLMTFVLNHNTLGLSRVVKGPFRLNFQLGHISRVAGAPNWMTLEHILTIMLKSVVALCLPLLDLVSCIHAC